MLGIIDELRREHAMLLEMLGEVRKMGISSPAGRERLLSAKDLLLSHIQKEEERFYPTLRKTAENDDDLRHTLEYFAQDMEAVTKKADTLFRMNSQGGSDADLAGDLTIFYMMLQDRIRVEEQVLFEKHESASAKTALE